ncbi:hypothetical protein GCM10010388_00950 [Streptomyces mauvecolor]
MAGDVAAAWREFHREIDREYNEAERRRERLSWQRSDQVAIGCHKIAKELADKLWGERSEAEHALVQCKAIVEEFSARLGLSINDEQSGSQDWRAALDVLSGQLVPAKQRLAKLLSKDQRKLYRLAELERRKRQVASTPVTTIEQLDAMEQHEFDDAVRRAFESDGFHAASLNPRILEISRDGVTGLVFCDHVRFPAPDAQTDVRTIVTAQRLASERDDDSIVVISNLAYISRSANRHCADSSPAIELVQRPELQQWIEWGVPLRNRSGLI